VNPVTEAIRHWDEQVRIREREHRAEVARLKEQVAGLLGLLLEDFGGFVQTRHLPYQTSGYTGGRCINLDPALYEFSNRADAEAALLWWAREKQKAQAT